MIDLSKRDAVRLNPVLLFQTKIPAQADDPENKNDNREQIKQRAH